MSKNLNYELKKEENFTCDQSRRGVEAEWTRKWPMGRGLRTG
jgi:hypothetical protein